MQGAPTPTRGLKFRGSYLFQMDEKGRVALPAAFRREAADQRFILMQAYTSSLALYPEAEWAGVEERLSELLTHNPKARTYVLSIMSSVVEVVPDSQGRILIPVRLKDAAHLEGPVQLVGVIDRIEIWNPDRFEEAVSAEASGFEQFAPQIFR